MSRARLILLPLTCALLALMAGMWLGGHPRVLPDGVRTAFVEDDRALRALRTEHHVRSILCEGGPTLNAELLRAGLVDELFLSVAPKLTGGTDPLTIVAGAALPEPAELDLVWLLEHEGELFLRLRVNHGGRNRAADRP